MEDSEIIRLFFERSEQAIGELDKKYGAAATKTAANILHDRLDVEECVNDTLSAEDCGECLAHAPEKAADAVPDRSGGGQGVFAALADLLHRFGQVLHALGKV